MNHFPDRAFQILINSCEMSAPLFRIFSNTASGVSSLNGGTPVKNSNMQTPRAHQSTAGPTFNACQ